MLLALTNNVLQWPWWLQLIGIATVAFALVQFWTIRPSASTRRINRLVSEGMYEYHRKQRHERRAEDLIWEVCRQEAYELAVDLALERAGGNVAVGIARTARSQQARAHLQVVA
jgi:hypothetical protein